jgi:hypothetical protein
MPRNGGLPNPKQVQSPLQDMPERRLGQLLEELLTNPGKKDRNLVLIFLLLEAGIVKYNELGGPSECRQMTVETPWLLPQSPALPTDFPVEHGTETQDTRLEGHAADGLTDQG